VPALPALPVLPVLPVFPVFPVLPVLPVLPMEPVAPVAPGAPGAPVLPVLPVLPWGPSSREQAPRERSVIKTADEMAKRIEDLLVDCGQSVPHTRTFAPTAPTVSRVAHLETAMKM
jgi:hypothetical protein